MHILLQSFDASLLEIDTGSTPREQTGTVWDNLVPQGQEDGPGDPLRLPRVLSNLVLAPSWALT